MDLLDQVLGHPSASEPIRIPIPGAPDLAFEFRRPVECEFDEKKTDAGREAERYFSEEKKVTPQILAWRPARRESFIVATVLAAFYVSDGLSFSDVRRKFCLFSKDKPTLFAEIWSQFTNQVVAGEIESFVKAVEAEKKLSTETTSGSLDSLLPETSTDSTTTT